MRNMKPVWKYGIIALIDLLIISILTIIIVVLYAGAMKNAPFSEAIWYVYILLGILPTAAVRGIIAYAKTQKILFPSLSALIVVFPCLVISHLVCYSFTFKLLKNFVNALVGGAIFAIIYSIVSLFFSLIGFAYRKFSN